MDESGNVVANISTHTLTWSVTETMTGFMTAKTISTHTLTWSVTPLIKIYFAYCINFNSHAHVERDLMTDTLIGEEEDFNSHAHVERDGIAFAMAEQWGISTHTLTWSVTAVSLCVFHSNVISTHTLTWSVTVTECPQRNANQFQLTRSRGA